MYETDITLRIRWDASMGTDDPSTWAWGELLDLEPDESVEVASSNTRRVDSAEIDAADEVADTLLHAMRAARRGDQP